MRAESIAAKIASRLSIRQQVTTWTRSRLAITTAERRALLVMVDLVVINLALLAAVILWNDFAPSATTLIAHRKWFITLSVIYLGPAVVFDIYSLPRAASVSSILASVGLAAFLSSVIYLSIPWLTPPLENRGYAFTFIAFSLCLILCWRAFYAKVLSHPAFQQRALILGQGTTAQTLLRELNQASQVQDANPYRGTGYQVVGVVPVLTDAPPMEDISVPVLAYRDRHFSRPLGLQRTDEIIVAVDEDGKIDPQAYELLLNYREAGKRVSSFAEVYERLTGRLPVSYDRRDLSILIGPEDAASARLYRAGKILLDVILATCGLIPLLLVLPMVALANALTAPGPLFYTQERVGRGGKTFRVIKFRTMRPDAEAKSGAVWSSDNDPRVTPVGRWLRKTRLDEMPQVINVLRGDMSVIGPRPERPFFVQQIDCQLPLYRARHSVRPGITGWAQVHYRYGNSVEDSRIKLEYDLYYIKHASLYLDLLIILQTLRVMLQMKGT